MKTLRLSYDPLALVQIVLQRHVEETIEGKFYKAKQFACYDYLSNLSDEALEELLIEYMKRHHLEVITLADWRCDGKLIFDIIFEKPEYQQLEINFKKRGFGATGLGVLDVANNVFYDCGFLHHWSTIRFIVEKSYSRYAKALEQMYINERLVEFEGISRDELEIFITTNFELYGGSKLIREYL
ncbi:hypothetical protein UY286_04785 [Paenibacillus polymyxa]|uniref:hypothetical protein n=1 Tax=Paenibacillus polymyxa TaxID=1406 RepID=UPI002AB4BC29|nr:hypothetical protein [Paenibacillus polymyxa]MDY7989887.1 hypothetical protein [Paenibacillus polymyxa]MDY8116754.1 hypothetical protein [Paenibacillus polymyxa]